MSDEMYEDVYGEDADSPDEDVFDLRATLRECLPLLIVTAIVLVVAAVAYWLLA